MLQKTNEIALVEAIKKIPLLNGISPSRIRVLISLCEGRTLQPGTMLCSAGGISDELYILLVGELGVLTPDGMQVASLKPVNALGVGAITGQPRLAALKALKPTRVLVLRKVQLDRFFKADPPSCSRIYRNFIHILAEKVNIDNSRLRDLQGEQEHYSSRMGILERQLKVHQQRLHYTLDFVARRGFVEYGQAREQVDAQHPAARVLAVASEPDLRQGVKEGLAGMEVAEAELGSEALRAIKEQLPDLVITTLVLPEMDGLALLKQLRAYHPRLLVLVLVEEREAEVVADKGFDGVVGQPIDTETLRTTVEGLLQREGLA